jgi:hypothetical protein
VGPSVTKNMMAPWGLSGPSTTGSVQRLSPFRCSEKLSTARLKNAGRSECSTIGALLNTLCYGTFIPPQAEGDRLGQNQRGSRLRSTCARYGALEKRVGIRRIERDLGAGVGTVLRLTAEA